jgi:tetratricopeptide (TPR) repeat protein
LQRLPESNQQVIEAIAVLGLPVTPAQARQTSVRSEEETFSAIEWGLRQRLLLPQTDFQPPRYDFSHDLIREAVVEQLSQIRRQLLHRRAAITLETSQVAPATLAYHWRMAGNLANELSYTILAGKQAAAQFAHAEAVTYLSRALQLTSPGDWVQRYELLSLREQAYGAQGRREAQRQDLSLLKEAAETLADKQRQIAVALRQATLERDTSHFEQSVAVAQFAVQLAETLADVAQQARGHLQWGLTLWRQGDYTAAQVHLEQGRRLSQQAGLPAEEATGALALSAIYRAWGDYERAVAWMEQALQLSREIGDWQNEASALSDLGVIAHDRGDYLQADARYRQALEIYRRTGDRWNQALAMGNHGGLFIDLGDYETAGATLTEAAQIFIEIDDRRALSYQYCDLSLIAHAQGDQQTALAYSQQALELATAVGERPGQANALIKLGHAQAGLGRLVEASEAYRQSLAIERELGQLSPAMEALAGLARMALAQKELDQAKIYLQEILDYLEAHTLAGAWEPFRVYLTCYQVLQAAQDSRARDILQIGYRLLLARADKIGDPAIRRRYLEEVAVHREIVEAYEA